MRTETLLNIGGHSGGARLVLKQVNAVRGVGHARLFLTAEVTTKDAAAVGCPLYFSGRLEVLGIGGRDMAAHLASLAVHDRMPVLGNVGVDDHFTLVADVDDRQLRIIEEHRTGDLRLRVHLPGVTVREGRHEPFHANNIDYTVSQSDWISILEQVGFAKTLLIELPAVDPRRHPEHAAAIDYFEEAQRHYVEGRWRSVVESLRQSLAALVGKKAEDEDSADDVTAALKQARGKIHGTKVGYVVRYELARQALKFLCDLGAHPEIDETQRVHADSALLMASGLLRGYEMDEA